MPGVQAACITTGDDVEGRFGLEGGPFHDTGEVITVVWLGWYGWSSDR